MSTVLACAMVSLFTAMSVTAPGPLVLSRYREVALGDSLATAIERLQPGSSTPRVLSDHPSLVQEVTWRRQRLISGVTVAHDPLAEMVLTFHFDRLVRIVATYDREGIQGLTDADLVELVSAAYGAAMLPSTSTGWRSRVPSPRHTLATWADAETSVSLWREEYPRRAGLTISNIAGEAALDAAILEQTRRTADGEPQRLRDAQAATTHAIKEREERIRSANKAGFKP